LIVNELSTVDLKADGKSSEVISKSQPNRKLGYAHFLRVPRAFNFGEFLDEKAQQPLPEPLARSEASIGRFMNQCHSLCNQILQLFGKALEVVYWNKLFSFTWSSSR
jgi:hypothetical protein